MTKRATVVYKLWCPDFKTTMPVRSVTSLERMVEIVNEFRKCGKPWFVTKEVTTSERIEIA